MPGCVQRLDSFPSQGIQHRNRNEPWCRQSEFNGSRRVDRLPEFAEILDAICGVNAAEKLAHIGAIDIEAETRLDEDIQPDISTLDEIRIANPSAIFLTGATGFLGAFLLDELFQNTL